MIDDSFHPTFDANVLRRKAAFVLHALEQDLYKLACESPAHESEFPSGLLSSIRERAALRGADLSSADLSKHLQNAYLDEIFAAAAASIKGTALEPVLLELRERCRLADVFEIRNACAHPTRDFPLAYWYRVAAIAADPVVAGLKLFGVQKALVSAEEDRISDPPAEWVNRFLNRVPNNLPEDSPHDATGLVGREKEFSDLLDRVAAPGANRIAVTGYGGIGKTALVVSCLNRLCADPSILPGLRGVVMVSLKTELLTSAGLSKTAVDKTIADLRAELASTIRDMGLSPSDALAGDYSAISGSRMLICIDNAETILKESEAEFGEFLDSLPGLWKIIVTSRLAVDGARTVPLSPLGKSQSEFLARRYIAATNASVGRDVAGQVAVHAKGNPLCIRLIIDRMNLGHPLAQAAATSTEDLLKFSFTSLLEALPGDAIAVLEALYLAGESSRADLCELLELSDDDILACVRVLQRTSLVAVAAVNGTDVLTLSEAIKELFLARPSAVGSAVDVRERLRVRAQRLQAQKDHQSREGSDPWKVDYIPDSLPPALKDMMIDANEQLQRAKGQRERILRSASRFANAETNFRNDGYYWKTRGRLLARLGDPGAERCFVKALDLIVPKEPTIVVYANEVGKLGRCGEVFEMLDPLYAQGLISDSGVDLRARRILAYNYVRSLRDLDRFEQVIEVCTQLRFQHDVSGQTFPFLISALRQRDMRSGIVPDYDRCMALVERCIEMGVGSPTMGEEFKKLLEDLLYDRSHARIPDDVWERIRGRLREVVPSISELFGRQFDQEPVNALVERIIGAPTQSEVQEALIAEGYLSGRVLRIPKPQFRNPQNFLIAQADSTGELFFCHRQSLSKEEVGLWSDLSPGDRVFVLPNHLSTTGLKDKTEQYRTAAALVVLRPSAELISPN
jgi:hypothetical protein